MLIIMEGVSSQIQKGEDRAAALVERRLREFEQSTLGEFAKPGGAADPEAFREPDFQFALRQAQSAYVRSGDDGLKDELIKLLAMRSGEKIRSRKALILNEAIQVVGNLTTEEISALVALFLFNNVHINEARDLGHVASVLNDCLSPFIDDFPTEDFSFDYLESMRCVTINQISHSDVWNILVQRYGNVFTKGFSNSDFVTALSAKSDVNRSELVQVNSMDFTGKIRFKPKNREDLTEVLSRIDPSNLVTQAVTDLWESSKMSDAEMKKVVEQKMPNVFKLASLWENSPAKSSNITGLGKVIAHSALTSRAGFSAPLEIWAK